MDFPCVHFCYDNWNFKLNSIIDHFIFLFCKKYQIKVEFKQFFLMSVNLLPYLLSLIVSAAGFFTKNMKKKFFCTAWVQEIAGALQDLRCLWQKSTVWVSSTNQASIEYRAPIEHLSNFKHQSSTNRVSSIREF